MSFAIRQTVPEDAQELGRWLNDPQILRWFPMNNQREIDDSVRIWMAYVRLRGALTATLDGKPIGMAVLNLQPFQKLSHQVILSIIMDEKYRGQGYGTKLMEKLIELAKNEHGIELLHLEVYEGNPALHLYERLGFKEYGRHPKFIKMDGKYLYKILMQKRL